MKKIFPLLWFGVLAGVVVVAFASGAAKRDPLFLVVPGVMLVLGVFIMKKMVWDLADEVYDCGDSLLVRLRGEEQRVDLANIMNVSVTTYVNPPRITLRLVEAGRFGKEIAFSPQTKFSLNSFARNPVSEDLIVRVDAARSRRGK